MELLSSSRELRVIKWRMTMGGVALVVWTYCFLSSFVTWIPWSEGLREDPRISFGVEVLMFLMVTGSVQFRWTLRWPITFPIVPFLLSEAVRYFVLSEGGVLRGLLTLLNVLALLLATLLGFFLFPPLDLRPDAVRNNIGVVDLYLPINEGTKEVEFLPCKLWYPTDEVNLKDKAEYLQPILLKHLCKAWMAIGPSPGVLSRLDWMLHPWGLVRLANAKVNAKLAPSPTRLPVVIFSHGNIGNAAIYSFQTMKYAMAGNIVLSLDHMDGSAVLTQRKDGSLLHFDNSLEWSPERKVEFVRRQRERCDFRVAEFLGATKAMISLNQRNIEELESLGLDLRGRMNLEKVIFAGHSFGGATALQASMTRPDIPRCVIALDPAVDWMNDVARRSLLPRGKLYGAGRTYEGGTGGYLPAENGTDGGAADNGHSAKPALADTIPPVTVVNGYGPSSTPVVVTSPQTAIHLTNKLMLYSYEWSQKKWGECDLVQWLHQTNQLGAEDRISEFGVVRESFHMEFSDICMLLPLWLTRPMGIANPNRSPVDVAEEMTSRTLDYIDEVWSRM